MAVPRAIHALDWLEAERQLRRLEQLVECPIPSHDVQIEWNLNAALIASFRQDGATCLNATTIVIDQLKLGQIKSRDDASYIARFMGELAWISTSAFPDLEQTFLDQAYRTLTLETPFSLKAVRSDWQARFRLTPIEWRYGWRRHYTAKLDPPDPGHIV